MLQIIKGKWEEVLCYTLWRIQVSELNQVIKALEVFVYLEQKISDFKDELKDEFVSSGGV